MASAPKSFGSQLQLNKIPLLGVVPESSGTAPSSPVAGQLWLDTSLTPSRLKTYENGGWVLVSQTGAELSANKGATNGYAALVSGTVPIGQLPTGSTSTTVAIGNDSRLSDNRTPTDASVTGGAAGAGVKLAANTITTDNIAAALKSAAAGVDSLRQIGTGALQALAGNTTLATIAAPAGSVSLNSQKIVSLADPTSAQDAATKAYVDSLSAGLDPKASVRAASTANVVVTYSATGGTSARGQITVAPNTLDGVTLAAGNRILLKDQSTGAQNGIWVVSTLGSGANGVWDRAGDFDSDTEVTSGAFVFVEEGTANDNTGWVLTTSNPIIIGGGSGTSIAFAQFSSAGSVTAGAGMTQVGNTLNVIGTASRISVAADAIDIDTGYVGQTSITTLGTVATGTWSATAIAVAKGGTGATDAATARTNLSAAGKYAGLVGALVAGTETLITHSLGTQDVIAKFFDATTLYEVELSWRHVSTTQIGVTADVAYASNAIRAVVIG